MFIGVLNRRLNLRKTLQKLCQFDLFNKINILNKGLPAAVPHHHAHRRSAQNQAGIFCRAVQSWRIFCNFRKTDYLGSRLFC